MTDAAHAARSMWTLFEPIHAVTYFAPQARAAFEQAGLRGFWRGYFAGRAAPLGPVSAAVVTASFFNFAPGMVARAIPGVWELISPEEALRVRVAGACQALGGLLAGLEAAAEAAPACCGGRSANWTARAGCWPRPTPRCPLPRTAWAAPLTRAARLAQVAGTTEAARPVQAAWTVQVTRMRWPGSGRRPPCCASTAATGIRRAGRGRASTAARPWSCAAAWTCGGRTCSRSGAGPTRSGMTPGPGWPSGLDGPGRQAHRRRPGRARGRGGRHRPGRARPWARLGGRGHGGTRRGAHSARAGLREPRSRTPAPSAYPPRPGV